MNDELSVLDEEMDTDEISTDDEEDEEGLDDDPAMGDFGNDEE